MRKLFSAILLASTSVAAPAMAAGIITNGTIQLGVGDFGQLNFTGVGLKDLRTGRESIAPGCECEGWGVANAADGTTGYANNSVGTANVVTSSVVSTASPASAVVAIAGVSAMQVTHTFAPSASADLYEVLVTIKNLSANAITDLRYRRVMDWDIEPTAFSELVTIQGVGATNLLYSSDQGFASADPLAARGSIASGTVNTNFVDSGPFDHGALFDFGFGSLAAGDTKTFKIFYGASLTEAGALSALGTVGAELYSFGQSKDDVSGGRKGYSTFIFGFKGVGGTVVPGAVPESTTWLMMIAGFGIAGMSLRSRRRNAIATLA